MESQQSGTEFARRLPPPPSPMEVFAPVDSDDPFSLSALLSLDSYPELCSPSAAGQVLSPFSYASSPFQQISTTWASLASPSPSADVVTLDSSSPRSVDGGGVTLAERMLRALSLFKESSGGGILAQVWMPVRHGDGQVLSTSEQPFLLDQVLAGYREVSRAFTFSAEETAGDLLPGLPGRVFLSGLPEWTPNVEYYYKFEYLRAEYAKTHQVRGSLAVPIFDPKARSCCAVLELVTTREKPDFDVEMESVCNALQAVDLRSVKGQAFQQIFFQVVTKNQRSAFNEILDVLRTCCHAHMLPLALTWVPFSCDGERDTEDTKEVVSELDASLRRKNLLCIEKSACYVNDARMKGFLHACAEHCLEQGQGIAGKALQSNHPFFSPNVKSYDILEYPLAHHARKYGLHAAVAIRLRSTLTGNDDYILEFFLPINCRGSSEQQGLLNNLSATMQRICRSLRTVSDAEMVAVESSKVSSSSAEVSLKHSQQMDSDTEISLDLPFEDASTQSGEHEDSYNEQTKSDLSRQPEKKRSTAEKNISLSVLQQYFSGSLKDAAKSIGVCPTTLKRICRQHGISRWPSRKINKVNRSLKKIQNVINSVQGVEGALKYDPVTGCLVAAVSAEKSNMSHDSVNQDAVPSSSTPEIEAERFVKKLEINDSPVAPHKTDTHKLKTDKACLHQNVWTPEAKGISFLAKGGLSMETFEPQVATDFINPRVDMDVVKEHSHPSSSSMTGSSSGSASSLPKFKKASKDKVLVSETDTRAAITVKATYKDDTVRFKFLPAMGCHQLFEEIGKRYKLAVGTFQLKYMDDEEEWVMLSSQCDLIECIEVLESIGSRTLKLMVRDLQCSFGSSGGSNFLQA